MPVVIFIFAVPINSHCPFNSTLLCVDQLIKAPTLLCCPQMAFGGLIQFTDLGKPFCHPTDNFLMPFSLKGTCSLSTQEKPSFGSIALCPPEFTHPSHKHLLSTCLSYTQLYTMNSRDYDDQLSFYFEIISKCITSSKSKQKKKAYVLK